MATSRTQDLHVDVHYLTRVEGHGNIVVDTRDGRLERCELEVVEAPRFFEAMLRGRPYEQASHLASRICGICAVAHATASLRATERALRVEITPQTQRLRRLNFCGEMLDSHILHAYMLVAPDLVNLGSAVALARVKPDIVVRALRMKKLAGDLCAVLGGRHTHPISMTVGGFLRIPKAEELRELLRQLEAAAPDVEATVELFASLPLPSFARETEYVALRKPGEYAFIDGEIASSDGGSWPLESYREVAREDIVKHSTAKHTRHARESYMVGALARYLINHDRLHPKAQATAKRLGLTPACRNPYWITVAQVVELVHSYEDAKVLIDRLLTDGLRLEPPAAPARRSGEGVGAVEAPRGTLYHHYAIEDGVLTQANCIIPTGQNLANIEADMRALVPQILSKGKEEVTRSLEMLVRAYDPCISCSTHMLEVRFV
ncbi:MAG TPA: Ni/Fe hydrogenase subunit alpha [Anaerolineales bacterium]|nr:Ni/Fe hydrogenase subunit alpha [Anaerolineales bacterium]